MGAGCGMLWYEGLAANEKMKKDLLAKTGKRMYYTEVCNVDGVAELQR